MGPAPFPAGPAELREQDTSRGGDSRGPGRERAGLGAGSWGLAEWGVRARALCVAPPSGKGAQRVGF